jgi:hypothetical protein
MAEAEANEAIIQELNVPWNNGRMEGAAHRCSFPNGPQLPKVYKLWNMCEQQMPELSRDPRWV